MTVRRQLPTSFRPEPYVRFSRIRLSTGSALPGGSSQVIPSIRIAKVVEIQKSEAQHHRHDAGLLRIPLSLSLRPAPGLHRRAACFWPVCLGFPGCVASLEGNLQHELAYSVLCPSLAHTSMDTPPRLRSLHCSRLSSGVTATMNRSDPSTTPTRSVQPLTRRLRREVVGSLRAAEVSPGHAHLCSTHPDANHVTGSCAGLRPLRQARPPVPPNRVHFRFGLSFGSDPSPPSSRKTAVSAYGSTNMHRYSRRDFNPLDTCAARRTEVRLRGLNSEPAQAGFVNLVRDFNPARPGDRRTE